MMRLLLPLFVLAVLSQQLQCQGRRVLCGEALNDALDLICVNGFSRKLRRDVASDRPTEEQPLLRLWHMMALDHQLDKIEQRQTHQDLDIIKGATTGQEWPRSRRSISHDCCNRGCSYDDIRTYCA